MIISKHKQIIKVRRTNLLFPLFPRGGTAGLAAGFFSVQGLEHRAVFLRGLFDVLEGGQLEAAGEEVAEDLLDSAQGVEGVGCHGPIVRIPPAGQFRHPSGRVTPGLVAGRWVRAADELGPGVGRVTPEPGRDASLSAHGPAMPLAHLVHAFHQLLVHRLALGHHAFL